MFGSRAREWYFGEINLVLFINTFFYFVKFILRKTSNNQLFPSFFFFFLYLLLEHDVILKFFLYFLLFRLFLSSDLCFRVLRCPDNSTQMDTADPDPIHSGLRTTSRSTSCSEIKKKKRDVELPEDPHGSFPLSNQHPDKSDAKQRGHRLFPL